MGKATGKYAPDMKSLKHELIDAQIESLTPCMINRCIPATTASSSKSVSPIKAKPTQSKTNGNKGDPIKAILTKMGEMKMIGINEVKEEELVKATGYARHDSKGHRNAVNHLVRDVAYISKNPGKVYVLTEKGYKHLIESGIIELPKEPANEEEYFEQLLGLLFKSVKAPKPKIQALWDTLKDEQPHPITELVKVAGYERPDSKGYRNIIKGMDTLELVEKCSNKCLKFTAKVFKFRN